MRTNVKFTGRALSTSTSYLTIPRLDPPQLYFCLHLDYKRAGTHIQYFVLRSITTAVKLQCYRRGKEYMRTIPPPPSSSHSTPDFLQNMEVVHPQLWIFDFDTSSWSCVEAREGGGGRRGKASGTGGSANGGGGPDPPAVFDHTATRVGHGHIVVIGGAMVGTALNSKASLIYGLW